MEAARWACGIDEFHRRIVARSCRSEPRQRALPYLKGLVRPVERKNVRAQLPVLVRQT